MGDEAGKVIYHERMLFGSELFRAYLGFIRHVERECVVCARLTGDGRLGSGQFNAVHRFSCGGDKWRRASFLHTLGFGTRRRLPSAAGAP